MHGIEIVYFYVPNCREGLETLQEINKWGDRNKQGGGRNNTLKSKIALL